MPEKSPFFCRKLKSFSKKPFSFKFESGILLPYISLYNNTGCLIDLYCEIKYQSITHHTEVSIFHISFSEMRLSMKNSNYICCIFKSQKEV